jgi:cytochrome c
VGSLAHRGEVDALRARRRAFRVRHRTDSRLLPSHCPAAVDCAIDRFQSFQIDLDQYRPAAGHPFSAPKSGFLVLPLQAETRKRNADDADVATPSEGAKKMNPTSGQRRIALMTLSIGLTLSFAARAGIDVDAAKALARQNNCFKCHAIEKDKDGPAWKKVAEKYKGKDTGEARLIEHITSGEKAKFPDGHEEEHKIVETSPPKDMAQIKNLVDWILSL